MPSFANWGVTKGNRMSVQIELDRKRADALLRKLARMGYSVQRKVIRRALSKAATPIASAMRKLAPKGPGMTSDGRPRPHLKRSIGKSKVIGFGSGARIRIGPDYKKAPHAHLVEFGTKQRTRKKLGGKFAFVKNATAEQLRTGSAPEKSFLRKAFKGERKRANSIIVNELRTGIAREARRR